MNSERQFEHTLSLIKNSYVKLHNQLTPSGNSKFCPKCEHILPLENFYRHKGRSDGRDCYCGSCRKKIQLGLNLKENNRRNIALHRQRYPEKERARKLTGRAIRKGILTKLPCEFSGCLSLSVQAHHEDYSKPLEVVWLCRKHHHEYHRWVNDAKRFLDETFRGVA